jgi:hypothetical protein
MKKTVLVLMIIAVAAVSIAQAEVNVNVNVGLPAPRIAVPMPPPPPPLPRMVVSDPPTVVFEVAPQFIAPPGLGFYVAVDTPYDLFFNANYYYLYSGNAWHRARNHNGPWVVVPYKQLPPGIRKHRIEEIRSHRDREYRVYHENRDHYRGRHFQPGHEQKKEWKEERRHDKEERKEEHRRDKEERREEKHHGHDRD